MNEFQGWVVIVLLFLIWLGLGSVGSAVHKLGKIMEKPLELGSVIDEIHKLGKIMENPVEIINETPLDTKW